MTINTSRVRCLGCKSVVSRQSSCKTCRRCMFCAPLLGYTHSIEGLVGICVVCASHETIRCHQCARIGMPMWPCHCQECHICIQGPSHCCVACGKCERCSAKMEWSSYCNSCRSAFRPENLGGSVVSTALLTKLARPITRTIARDTPTPESTLLQFTRGPMPPIVSLTVRPMNKCVICGYSILAAPLVLPVSWNPKPVILCTTCKHSPAMKIVDLSNITVTIPAFQMGIDRMLEKHSILKRLTVCQMRAIVLKCNIKVMAGGSREYILNALLHDTRCTLEMIKSFASSKQLHTV